MDRFVIWRGLDGWRADGAQVQLQAGRLSAQGTQFGADPYRLDYRLLTGPDFVTRTLELSLLRAGALKRLRELEQIAQRHTGVEKVYAMQAGREIRVIVRPEDVDDDSAALHSHRIARDVEKELEYAGQIKVTVIRESRAVDYAK